MAESGLPVGSSARPGPDFYDARISKSRRMLNHIGLLGALGYKVAIEPRRPTC